MIFFDFSFLRLNGKPKNIAEHKIGFEGYVRHGVAHNATVAQVATDAPAFLVCTCNDMKIMLEWRKYVNKRDRLRLIQKVCKIRNVDCNSSLQINRQRSLQSKMLGCV